MEKKEGYPKLKDKKTGSRAERHMQQLNGWRTRASTLRTAGDGAERVSQNRQLQPRF